MSIGTATTVIYPETDGMPLPDGMYQSPIYTRTLETLQMHFAKVPGAWVNGNTFLYYEEGNPRRHISPDCMIVTDMPAAAHVSFRRHNTYLLWEVGVIPDFVMEIASKSTASRDLNEKRDLYARLGIKEYWRYDETGGDFYREPLVGERLVDGEYHRLSLHDEPDGRVWGRSDELNLDLYWEDGELRFWDFVEGDWLRTPQEAENERIEERAGRLAERELRLAELDRRLTERDRRLAAEQRAAELEAEIRRLRGE